MQIVLFVEKIVEQFRETFSREATFEWFVIVFWALMLRMDMAGVTSIIRCMGLDPGQYFCLLHFFKSSGFCVQGLCETWYAIVLSYGKPVCVKGKPLYLIDGIKVGKAGKKMPGVKLLHQESEDNTKPEYIMGHFWGAISKLVYAPKHVFSVPLRFQIQDGLKRSPAEVATLVDKMGTLVTQTLDGGIGIVIGDAYYSTKRFITTLLNSEYHYIGKIKISTVGYHLPEPSPLRRPRGRPPIYGQKVKLKELFKQKALFKPASITLYGKIENVHYLSIDLMWQGIYVRFVLTIMSDGKRAILVSTDLCLEPEDIIFAYGLRQKIEVSFQSLIHILSGFCYHFWMMSMTKIKRGSGDQYLHRASDEFRQKVFRKIESYERFVNITAIALGVLQLVAIQHHELIWDRFPVWLRTLPNHGCPSEHVVRLTLQHELHQIFLKNNDSPLLAKILAKKKTSSYPAHPLKIAA